MNIGIDIDDTISETFETLLPYSQKYTIEDLKRESKIDFRADLSNHFYIVYMNNWTEKEAINFCNKYCAEILKKVNIKTFAAEVINKLKAQGHKIYLITARWDIPGDNVKEITRKWLEEKEVQYDELIINASDKAKLVEENKIDIFIDDSFNNCKSIVEDTNSKVYMMTSRVNGNLEHDNIKRVFSWPEIYDLINKEES